MDDYKACAQCSAMFSPKERRNPGARFCSRACASRWQKAVAGQTLDPRSCGTCGATYKPVQRDQRYCGRECIRQADRPLKIFAPTACPGCSAVFVPMPTRAALPSLYCSDSCREQARRDAKAKYRAGHWRDWAGSTGHRKRARHYGTQYEPIKRVEVFDRDGWRCGLCGTQTPRHLMGSCDDRAPELDHIVPLSRGGDHLKRNVRCACRRCNRLKYNRTDMELVGLLLSRGETSLATRIAAGGVAPSSQRIAEKESGHVS